MCWPCLPLGVVTVLAGIVDLLWTALWVDGGSGPIASRVSSTLWRVFAFEGVGSLRTLAGPVTLVATIATWAGLLIAGWTLVFASTPAALVTADPAVATGLPGRLYYVVYFMFGAGNGDFLPASGTWQIATATMVATGLLLLTLAISYVLSVIGAVPDKRAFATGVEGLGSDPVAFVLAGWNGDSFEGLEVKLDAFAQDLDRLAQEHLAYPILHYYHTRRDAHSAALALAVFDEALTILRFGVPEHVRPDPAVLSSARAASRNYLATLEEVFELPGEDAPPTPDLTPLEEASIPTVDPEAFHQAVADLAKRRAKLRAVVDADRKVWP